MKIGERRINLIKYVFALYSLSVAFSQKFSRSLDCILSQFRFTQTDGRTDGIAVAYTRYGRLSRVKTTTDNYAIFAHIKASVY